MNLISIKYHKIVDFESLFCVACQNTWETNREDSHPKHSNSKKQKRRPLPNPYAHRF